MAEVAKRFSESLVEYYTSTTSGSLANVLLGYSIRKTSDFSVYLSGRKELADNEILMVVNVGNASRTQSDTLQFWQVSGSIMFYVPLNHREEIDRYLEAFAQTESDETSVKTIGTYYATFNYNTPMHDGLVFNLNGKPYALITMMVNIVYTNSLFGKSGIPYITIGGTQLKNIRSFVDTASQNCVNLPENGTLYETKYYQYDVRSYTIEFIVDKNNALHLQLLRTAAGYDTITSNNVPASESFSLTQTIVISDVAPVIAGVYHSTTFTGHLQLNRPESRSGFTVMQIVVSR